MAKLTAEKRDALPAKDFAGPARSYPIEDKSHARNALSRVVQHGTPAEKSEVRAKVHEKFPTIGKPAAKPEPAPAAEAKPHSAPRNDGRDSHDAGAYNHRGNRYGGASGSTAAMGAQGRHHSTKAYEHSGSTHSSKDR